MLHLCTSSIMKCYFNKIFHLPNSYKRDYSWGIKWIFIVLSWLFLISAQVKQCMTFSSEAGWTVPEGTIFVKFDDNLQIWCNLNETFVEKYPGANSWNIYFTRNHDRIEERFIATINETTAILIIKSPPAGYFTYSCILDLPGDRNAIVGVNAVFVAYKPRRPSFFICRSYNWKRITCTWDVSQQYNGTTYKLFYKIYIAGRRKLISCPIKKARNDSCTWALHTKPIYRQTKKIYKFVMYVENKFGRKSFRFKIDHYAIVIPPKPVHLSLINKTSDGATLCWESRRSMWSFPPGLTHKVMYKSQWDYEKDWKIININTYPQLLYKMRCFTLTGLYANAAYTARIYFRSARAVGEDMYSKPAVIIFKTLPTCPSFPPRTDMGSFEIVEHNKTRDVYLYWQMIQEYHKNGDKLKYQVIHVEEDDHKIVLEPIEITKSYAKFEGLSFNKYRFKIVSKNEIGISKNYTEIIVPNRVLHGPLNFTKMAFGRGLYKLSWSPSTYKYVTNYTIFWYDNERGRPYQCTGYLNWTHVSMNTTVYYITVLDANKIYHFAISANTNNGSSGMKWSLQ